MLSNLNFVTSPVSLQCTSTCSVTAALLDAKNYVAEFFGKKILDISRNTEV